MSPGRLLLLSAAVAALAASVRAQSPATSGLVFVGTYTGEKSQGIYAFRFDRSSGALSPLGLVAETRSPSFLALHPSGRVLYAVNELDDVGAEKGGSVSAFTLDRGTGRLTLLNTQPSRGAHPCHLTVDRTGRFVLVANYTGGNLSVLPVASDGRLGPPIQVVQHTGSSVNRERQQGPHAHFVTLDPTNRFAIAVDLGADKLFVYRFDEATGGLTPNDPPWTATAPGAGPRHFTFHPNGRLAFAINELTSTITTYAWDGERGTLTAASTTPTTPGPPPPGNSTAQIRVHPNGRVVYGSNRGHDSIAVLQASLPAGQLTPVAFEPTRGRTPRNFELDPSGQWLIAANQRSDSLAVFRVSSAEGTLSPSGKLVPAPSPVCVLFLP